MLFKEVNGAFDSDAHASSLRGFFVVDLAYWEVVLHKLARLKTDNASQVHRRTVNGGLTKKASSTVMLTALPSTVCIYIPHDRPVSGPPEAKTIPQHTSVEWIPERSHLTGLALSPEMSVAIAVDHLVGSHVRRDEPKLVHDEHAYPRTSENMCYKDHRQQRIVHDELDYMSIRFS